MTDDVAARARQALKGITPGPWEVNTEGWVETTCNDCGGEVHERAQVAISIEDAEFIAAAPDLVSELVDALETTRAERDRLHNEAAVLKAQRDEARAELNDRDEANEIIRGALKLLKRLRTKDNNDEP